MSDLIGLHFDLLDFAFFPDFGTNGQLGDY